jgi:hypothetical protein
MPYFEQGQEKLHVVYVQNENWVLDPNFQITCVRKKGVLPTLCQIIQNYVKSNCNMLKSTVRLVDYSYVKLVKSIVDMTNSNANLVKFKVQKWTYQL